MGESARDRHYATETLRTAIADVLRDGGLPAATRRALRSAALSGLCIVSLAPAASALSLGELDVRSRLGEPLEALLPLTLRAGETLAAGCISQSQATDGLARLPQLSIQAPVTSQAGIYTVRLATPRPLHEPMYGIELRVACPGTPVMVRQYVLMLDLPGAVLATPPAAMPSRPAVPATPAAARNRPAPAATSAPRPAARAERTPIDQGSSYRVAAGDTLSLIAQRVAEREGVSIWEMAARIQQANPSAFINGNPDLIRLGSELTIPLLGESPALATGAEARPVPAAVVPPPLPAETTPATATPAPAVPSAPVVEAEPAANWPAAEDVALASARAPEPVAGTAETAAVTAPPFPAALLESPASDTATAGDTAAVAPPPAPQRGANPLLATAVGIGVGLLISLLFGRISLAGLRRGQADAAGRRPTLSPAPVSRSHAEDEAGMTVVESPAQDVAPEAPPAAALAASDTTAVMPAGSHDPAPTRPLAGVDWRDLDEDITDELSALFEDEELALPDPSPTATTNEVPALAGDTVQAPAVEQTDLDSLDPAATAEISGLDWDTLDVSVEDQLAGADEENPAGSEAEPTASDWPAAASSTPIDLPALAASATHDEKLSASLVEALKLLEQDYQQEMTATQLTPMAPAEALSSEPTATEAMQPVIEGDTVEQPAPLKRQGVG